MLHDFAQGFFRKTKKQAAATINDIGCLYRNGFRIVTEKMTAFPKNSAVSNSTTLRLKEWYNIDVDMARDILFVVHSNNEKGGLCHVL